MLSLNSEIEKIPRSNFSRLFINTNLISLIEKLRNSFILESRNKVLCVEFFKFAEKGRAFSDTRIISFFLLNSLLFTSNTHNTEFIFMLLEQAEAQFPDTYFRYNARNSANGEDLFFVRKNNTDFSTIRSRRRILNGRKNFFFRNFASFCLDLLEKRVSSLFK